MGAFPQQKRDAKSQAEPTAVKAKPAKKAAPARGKTAVKKVVTAKRRPQRRRRRRRRSRRLLRKSWPRARARMRSRRK